MIEFKIIAVSDAIAHVVKFEAVIFPDVREIQEKASCMLSEHFPGVEFLPVKICCVEPAINGISCFSLEFS